MSFQISQGLFNSDFVDYHAILGVPVDAGSEEIRKRYMKIAKKLHPDSSAMTNDEDKKRAAEILSKLVNPAKEKLLQEKERAEHGVILRLKGQQARKQQETIELQSELSRQLAAPQSKDQLDGLYKKMVLELATKQYNALTEMPTITGEISELNLVYLMLKGDGATTSATPAKAAKPSAPSAKPGASKAGHTAPPPPRETDVTDQFYRRALELVEKQNFAQAILELREALKLKPDNSRCHSFLGEIYMKQNQATMAKVHINQALKLDPKDAKALECKKKLEAQANKATVKSTSSKASSKATASSGKSGKKSEGDDGITIFGFKFGGKKK